MKSNVTETLIRRGCVALAAVALTATAGIAHAANLASNGSFETWSGGTNSSEFGTRFPSQTLAGWSTSAYAFVFTPSDPNATSEFGADDVALWGPGNGGITPPVLGPSPDGGNFVAIDGSFTNNSSLLSQTINGLVAGQQTTVSFWWAAAQQGPAPGQGGFSGDTDEQFVVSLGGQTQSTAVINLPSHSFSGWQQVSMTFTPTSTSEVLSFLAVGHPDSSEPPMALLDGISVSQTPEPTSLALLATGLFSVGGVARMRFKKQ